MGLFDRFRKPNTPPPPAEVTLDELAARARGGDSQGALSASTEKLARIAARDGSTSPAYAAALFEHGSLCLLLGMVPRAVESIREASEIRGTTDEHEKSRLTYLMNLGDTLGYAGQLEEALAVHEQGLVERERFYGIEHPGYAYGLDSKADVALALGRYQEALEAAQRSLGIFDTHRHPQIPHAWALVFLGAAGINGSWQDLRMEPAMADAILDVIASRRLPVDPAVEHRALDVLTPYAGDRERVLRAWVAADGRARDAKNPAARIAALERIQPLCKETAKPALAIDARLAIALCRHEQGNPAAAAATYDAAIEEARISGSQDIHSKVLRNAGLFFVDHDADKGLALLREAAALPAQSSAERGRAQIALGIQLQHRADLAGGRTMLAAGLDVLDPADRDALCGRSHLRAIDENGSCGCGNIAREVHAQIERTVRERLPEGLLDRLEFEAGNVGIHVTRAVTKEEAAAVAECVQLAMAELKRRLGQWA